jgi:hypothetical protein
LREAAAGLLLACATATSPALAQSAGMATKEVPAGKTTPIVGIWNCQTGTVSDNVQAVADKGKAEVIMGKTERCGKPGEMVGIFCTPPPGFKGDDTVHIYQRGFRLEQKVIVR